MSALSPKGTSETRSCPMLLAAIGAPGRGGATRRDGEPSGWTAVPGSREIGAVSAVWMRVRSRVRRHVWATVAVAGAIAIVTAMVVVVVAGARRTSTAPDRYTASVGGNVDGLIQQRSGQPLTDRIAGLPGVKQVGAYTFMFGGLESVQHKVPATLVTFAGERPLTSHLVAGRDLNPSHPHEFVADTSFTKATGARVGDRFAFRSISRAQIASGQGFGAKPQGAAFDATLVGVIDSPDEINSDFTVAIFPKALLHEDVGFVATVMQVRLRPGFSALDLRR